MTFVVPYVDVRYMHDDGMRFFDRKQEKQIEAALLTAEPRQENRKLQLEPDFPRSKAADLIQEPYFGYFMIHEDWARQNRLRVSRDWFCGQVETSRYGNYLVYSTASMEAAFRECLEYSQSEFANIKDWSVDREKGPIEISRKKHPKDWTELSELREPRALPDPWIPARACLSTAWPYDVFCFDELLYLNANIALTGTGLVPTLCTAEILPNS
ncbi:hypothetical protein TRP8649_00836 [Pelagimonas phthalicica]|uniref:Uncharacterized protein n=1 Tax=Pelagimonas phthalicica TaxID=1037362 RepID=A0A238J7N3_9RHOB|nr:hypothetical protein [Pelagimonas phthalicica]TDS94721.1 hypothetical protein CLV87_1235 [Pelagimonas phthalicica]SMX26751.1 hypothetical protein TRP8649_00836 [Pelagimonas phthalicica]